MQYKLRHSLKLGGRACNDEELGAPTRSPYFATQPPSPKKKHKPAAAPRVVYRSPFFSPSQESDESAASEDDAADSSDSDWEAPAAPPLEAPARPPAPPPQPLEAPARPPVAAPPPPAAPAPAARPSEEARLLANLRGYLADRGVAACDDVLGWTVRVETRRGGKTAGTKDVYYAGPAGRYRSRREVAAKAFGHASPGAKRPRSPARRRPAPAAPAPLVAAAAPPAPGPLAARCLLYTSPRPRAGLLSRVPWCG